MVLNCKKKVSVSTVKMLRSRQCIWQWSWHFNLPDISPISLCRLRWLSPLVKRRETPQARTRRSRRRQHRTGRPSRPSRPGRWRSFKGTEAWKEWKNAKQATFPRGFCTDLCCHVCHLRTFWQGSPGERQVEDVYVDQCRVSTNWGGNKGRHVCDILWMYHKLLFLKTAETSTDLRCTE